MIRRIDHIAIAVRDLEKAKAFFIEGLGGRQLCSMSLEPQQFRWTSIELGSSCLIELIDPIGREGFVSRFLDRRGEGPHHITIQVDDIHETVRTLAERGIETFGFSDDVPGWKECFIHPKNAHGVLLQFAEFNPLDWIEQGYVPECYREFVGKECSGQGEEPVTVCRARDEEGDEIEIRRGTLALRIPRSEIGALVRALESLR